MCILRKKISLPRGLKKLGASVVSKARKKLGCLNCIGHRDRMDRQEIDNFDRQEQIYRSENIIETYQMAGPNWITAHTEEPRHPLVRFFDATALFKMDISFVNRCGDFIRIQLPTVFGLTMRDFLSPEVALHSMTQIFQRCCPPDGHFYFWVIPRNLMQRVAEMPFFDIVALFNVDISVRNMCGNFIRILQLPTLFCPTVRDFLSPVVALRSMTRIFQRCCPPDGHICFWVISRELMQRVANMIYLVITRPPALFFDAAALFNVGTSLVNKCGNFFRVLQLPAVSCLTMRDFLPPKVALRSMIQIFQRCCPLDGHFSFWVIPRDLMERVAVMIHLVITRRTGFLGYHTSYHGEASFKSIPTWLMSNKEKSMSWDDLLIPQSRSNRESTNDGHGIESKRRVNMHGADHSRSSLASQFGQLMKSSDFFKAFCVLLFSLPFLIFMYHNFFSCFILFAFLLLRSSIFFDDHKTDYPCSSLVPWFFQLMKSRDFFFKKYYALVFSLCIFIFIYRNLLFWIIPYAFLLSRSSIFYDDRYGSSVAQRFLLLMKSPEYFFKKYFVLVFSHCVLILMCRDLLFCITPLAFFVSRSSMFYVDHSRSSLAQRFLLLMKPRDFFLKKYYVLVFSLSFFIFMYQTLFFLDKKYNNF